jgi:hypothetical protein
MYIYSVFGHCTHTHSLSHTLTLTHTHAPLVELLAVSEDLHAGLSVGVIGGLESHVVDADAREEVINGANQVWMRGRNRETHNVV